MANAFDKIKSYAELLNSQNTGTQREPQGWPLGITGGSDKPMYDPNLRLSSPEIDPVPDGEPIYDPNFRLLSEAPSIIVIYLNTSPKDTCALCELAEYYRKTFYMPVAVACSKEIYEKNNSLFSKCFNEYIPTFEEVSLKESVKSLPVISWENIILVSPALRPCGIEFLDYISRKDISPVFFISSNWRDGEKIYLAMYEPNIIFSKELPQSVPVTDEIHDDSGNVVARVVRP